MGRTKDSNHGHQDRQMMQWSGPRSELDFHGRLVSTRWQDYYGLGGGCATSTGNTIKPTPRTPDTEMNSGRTEGPDERAKAVKPRRQKRPLF